MDDIADLVEELPANFAVKPLYLADDAEHKPQEPESQRKIPISIVTGYLGSGKSTLLDRIGRTSNKRLAIILNEFGDTAAIEKSVTIQSDTEAVQEWLDLGNGCLCCTVKDNGVLAIEDLLRRARNRIDYILLETTGLADPAPIAQMFWLDEALASSVYIDGVITVVDASTVVQCLEDVGGHWHRANNHLPEQETLSDASAAALEEGITTAHLQIALADTILLNKIDKVQAEHPNDAQAAIDALKTRIRRINAMNPIHTTAFGNVALENILDLHAFEAKSQLLLSLLAARTDVFHDDRLTTVCLDFPFFDTMAGFARVETFIQQILWNRIAADAPIEVHRLKGILVHDTDVRVIQGVRDTYDIIDNCTLNSEICANRLVFIGKLLTRAVLEAELRKFWPY